MRYLLSKKHFLYLAVTNLKFMKHVLLPDSQERRLVFYLAMEELLARENNDEEVFFIWQVAPTVICGRNQNIEAEVNLDYCHKNKINVFRRKSGGGCVYSDEGNLMLTWITRSEGVQQTFDRYLQRIAELLNDTGAQATVSGRNDIHLLGSELSSKNRKYLEDGILDGMVDMNSYQQGYVAIRVLLENVLKGASPSFRNMAVPMSIVLKSNLQFFGNNREYGIAISNHSDFS